MKRAFLFLILSGLALGACGPQPIPTPDPLQVQASAAAIAGTAIAETRTAMPTATLPPTDTPTPPPTFTPAALPTQLTATPSLAAASGNCNAPLMSWDGPTVKVYLLNQTKYADVILSLGISTSMGECGYRGFNFGKSAQTDLPLGSYSAFAYVSNKFTVGGYFAITKEQNWSIIIKSDRIVLQAGCVRLAATC
jgi:hypothetical protein